MVRGKPTVERVQLPGDVVLDARKLMKAGRSMLQAATDLGVRSPDLDYSLWFFISVSDEELEPYRRPEPMF